MPEAVGRDGGALLPCLLGGGNSRTEGKAAVLVFRQHVMCRDE
ncbi:hypothetical protein [Thermanaeromonas toyohensis]|nr:hypothetical protein [Thermanaeromonas toyohensis]